MHSRPRSTPLLSDHERRCTGHEFPSWMKDPEKEKTWYDLQKDLRATVSTQLREKDDGTYRHWAFVSCEFIQMFTCFCLPDHDQFVHVSSGLKRCWERRFCYNITFTKRQTKAGYAERVLLTKYFPSDDMDIHRICAVCPTCRSSVPFLPPGIVCSFFPLSTSPEEIRKTLMWDC